MWSQHNKDNNDGDCDGDCDCIGPVAHLSTRQTKTNTTLLQIDKWIGNLLLIASIEQLDSHQPTDKNTPHYTMQ